MSPRAALGLLITTVVATCASVAAQSPITRPPDFAMPKAESSPGEVIFSHRAHAVVDKCSTCHMRDFKMQRGASGPVTLAAKQEGRFCGACHDGKTRAGSTVVFPIDECDRCHK